MFLSEAQNLHIFIDNKFSGKFTSVPTVALQEVVFGQINSANTPSANDDIQLTTGEDGNVIQRHPEVIQSTDMIIVQDNWVWLQKC